MVGFWPRNQAESDQQYVPKEHISIEVARRASSPPLTQESQPAIRTGSVEPLSIGPAPLPPQLLVPLQLPVPLPRLPTDTVAPNLSQSILKPSLGTSTT